MWKPVRTFIGVVAITLTSAACTGSPSVSSGSDPVASATAVSALPSNVGPSDCSPPSTTVRVGSNTQVNGQNAKDTAFWALFPARSPFPSGQDLRVRLAVDGAHNVRVIIAGPDGQEIKLDRVYPDFGASWGKPGDIWDAIVKFPAPGCWRVSVTRTYKHADFWVNVK
jgi:hypothetical protein